MPESMGPLKFENGRHLGSIGGSGGLGMGTHRGFSQLSRRGRGEQR